MAENMENENIVPNDRRAITIHSFLWGLATEERFLITDTKISIYYLPKNSYSHKEEGYVIEAQIKIVRDSKIEYITKEYFDKIYKEFENINLKALKKESYSGCDGGQLEVKWGMIEYDSGGLLFEPLRYTKKTKDISLWSPMEDKKRPEMSKLLKLIKSIETKIKFDKWYEYNYDEWEKSYNEIRKLSNRFRIGIECEGKINNLCSHCWIKKKRKNVCYFES
jgi:hypothetical protein